MRIAFNRDAPGEHTVRPASGEPVRVLLVFADPPGVDPLAVRLERERLRELFFKEILPKRNVEVDVICHGVTRARLCERIGERGGYDVIHWNGHGLPNALHLADGPLTGAELVALFQEANATVPSVMLLGSCYSGGLAPPKDWESLRRSSEEEAERGEGGGGYAGTALALVGVGVRQVAAMRWKVGDRYARRLARRFYKHLLLDEAQHTADKALSLARGELARDGKRKGEYHPADHVTPVMFGHEAVRVAAEKKTSRQMERREPRPKPLLMNGSKELDPPWGFVGRGEELSKLLGAWMEPRSKWPVALIQGLAGLGKTSLAAEVVHLGYEHFDYVLAFQAKGTPLGIEDLYRRIDHRLAQASPAYRERCKDNERLKVFLDAEDGFNGSDRYEQLAHNLVDAMGAERVLLLLDNFETNLLPEKGAYRCADPAWERLLEVLCDRLGETRSRVLVTSRHRPAVLDGKALWIPIGTLPVSEAKLYFENHPVLRAIWKGGEDPLGLARQILGVSRGHPLILARIADLARRHYDEATGLAPEGRAALEEALTRIRGDGYKTLPDVFAGVRDPKQKEQEQAYLAECAMGAVDLLIERLTLDARRLLWVVTRAGEPVFEKMIEHVWGTSPAALLGELCGTGLVTRDGKTYIFHELVGERATEWMREHERERGEQKEADLWTGYGEWHGAFYEALLASREPDSRDVAAEIGGIGVRYLARARAFDSLASFASRVVTRTSDPVPLRQMIADLRTVAAKAPAGEMRWCLRTCLADALNNAGQPEQAILLYAQAAEEAEAAAGWWDLAWVYNNWANALQHVGEPEQAFRNYLRSAEAKRRAGRSRVSIVGSELAALRIAVTQGRAAEAAPQIEARLGELRCWWALRRAGEPVPEIEDDENLADALMMSLDLARQTNAALECWQACLDLHRDIEQLQRDLGMSEYEIARVRINLYAPLAKLGKLEEARVALEHCLEVVHDREDIRSEVCALSALAIIWHGLGAPSHGATLERQALVLHERLSDPGGRAASHTTLAMCLDATGELTGARAHLLAALSYCLVTDLDASVPLNNLAVDVARSSARNEPFTFPRLVDLLTDPAFSALRTFLTDRAVDLPTLHARIDALVEEARVAAASPP